MDLPNFLMELRSYPRGVWDELHKISWPSWQETRQLTLIVVTLVAAASVIVSAIDLVLSQILERIL